MKKSKTQKITAMTAAAVVTGTMATAGTLTEPVIEEVMEPELEQNSSSGGILVPLLLLGAVAALVASSGDDDDTATTTTQGISDIRLKKSITRVGTTHNGLPIYRYQYLWSSKIYEGVMAQDVAKHMPEALIKGMFGVLLVNYKALGLNLRQVG